MSLSLTAPSVPIVQALGRRLPWARRGRPSPSTAVFGCSGSIHDPSRRCKPTPTAPEFFYTDSFGFYFRLLDFANFRPPAPEFFYTACSPVFFMTPSCTGRPSETNRPGQEARTPRTYPGPAKNSPRRLVPETSSPMMGIRALVSIHSAWECECSVTRAANLRQGRGAPDAKGRPAPSREKTRSVAPEDLIQNAIHSAFHAMNRIPGEISYSETDCMCGRGGGSYSKGPVKKRSVCQKVPGL